MIVGKLSIDPRRVISSAITQEHGRYTLAITIGIGQKVIELYDYFEKESDALRWQEQLDQESYKYKISDTHVSQCEDENNDLSMYIL